MVSKFIEEQRKKQEENRLKEKEKHLIDIGLFDESKATKKYSPFNESESIAYGYRMKDEKGRFRYEWETNDGKPAVLDVTDEEYEEICKLCPPVGNIIEDNFQKELLDKTDSIRRMVKFFVILTVISMACGLILAIIALA